MNPVIVLGMHRSGTSAVARLVQNLGLDVGTNLLPAAGGNVHGHFEEAAFIRFHDALIARFFPSRAPFCEWLPLTDAEVVYTDADQAEARSIWEAHRASGGNAWKDPRTSLFLDLWMEILPDARAIVCLRHPYQVHCSLLRRGEPFLHVDYGAAILGWTVYNQRILKAISALPEDRFIVLDVESAFRNAGRLTEELGRFLGLPVAPKACEAISPEDFHFENNSHESLESFEEFLPEAGAVYRRLKRLDFLAPVTLPATGASSSIRSAEARLIEFEETQGLRPKARKMLIRSIAVDRQRMLDLYRQAMKAGEEKDRLIEDLSKLSDQLKARIAALEGPSVGLTKNS